MFAKGEILLVVHRIIDPLQLIHLYGAAATQATKTREIATRTQALPTAPGRAFENKTHIATQHDD